MRSWSGWARAARWELVVAVAALLAAAVAVWVTLEADFLSHPGWLAAQKADFILGPVFVGLYWLRVRPQSRFGPMLIGFGLVGAIYIVQSSGQPWLFGLGLHWEIVVYLANLTLILTFPTGRLDGMAAKAILLAAIVFVAVPFVTAILLAPQLGADGSISGCLAACPENALAIASRPELATDIYRFDRVATIVVGLATGALLIWRMLRGTPPQRRAVAIGASVALVFTALQITYQALKLLSPDSIALQAYTQWALAGARSLIWYGFLAALIAAQLFAGRALTRLVHRSLRRPSQKELEEMLREPLGDPELELVFRDAERAVPEPGRAVTVVEREDRAPVAIVHDKQLDDDPELLQAAGAVALLAAENAELDAAWNRALDELKDSRARIVTAADDERRKLERDLHDGVQQRLVATSVNLTLLGETIDDPAVRNKLGRIGENVVEAIVDLREVAHGLYPPVLREHGLAAALEHVAAQTPTHVEVSAAGLDRLAPEVQSAAYHCCVEAIQNATKHGGTDVRVSVSVRIDDDQLVLQVSDDGPGFDPSSAHDGAGLHNMRERLGALDGRLTILSSPGEGTMVSGWIPLQRVNGRRAGAGSHVI